MRMFFIIVGYIFYSSLLAVCLMDDSASDRNEQPNFQTDSKSNSEWPIEPYVAYSRSAKKSFFLTLFVLFVSCTGLCFLLTLFYDRSISNQWNLLLCSFLCAIGFVILVGPAAIYLHDYCSLWLVLSFFETLALIMVLVSTKGYLLNEYPNISSEPVTLSLFSAYVSAAFLEELIKVIVYMTPVVFLTRYRTVYDLTFLAICSGASFGTIENLITAHAGFETVLRRFVWCTATHTSDCLAGAFIVVYVKTSSSLIRSKWRILLYPLVLLVPVCLHGSYDYVLFVSRDMSLPWLASLSILIGAVSLAVASALFFPFRRRKAPQVIVACTNALDR